MKLERRIHEYPLHKLNFLVARKEYTLELISQKCTYYEQKLNACSNNSRNILKTVNSILGSNINQKPNALTDSLTCASCLKCLSSKLFSISDCIKYITYDSSHCAQLLLLDLSSVFHTLNHNILIERIILNGIEGSPLRWLI